MIWFVYLKNNKYFRQELIDCYVKEIQYNSNNHNYNIFVKFTSFKYNNEVEHNVWETYGLTKDEWEIRDVIL